MLCIFALLLTGCQSKLPQQPVYGVAPAESEAEIFINGIPLKVYTAEEKEYLNMKEFADAVGEKWQVSRGILVHQASIFHGDVPYFFTTDTLPPEEDNCSLYLCGGIYDGSGWYQQLEQVMSLYSYHLLEDPEKNCSYYTTYPTAEYLHTDYSVPTLMYHAVGDEPWGIRELFVSPATLEEQLKYLTENGYTPIWFEDLGEVNQLQKPVLLTFDDGYDDNYTALLPLLKKYNVKATVFIIVDLLNTEHYLTSEQVKVLSESGLVSIQSHTMSHEFLSTRSAEQLTYELQQSKLALARITGKEPFAVSYPSGRYSDASLAAVEQYYQFGLLSSGGTYVTGAKRSMIPRQYVSRNTDLEEFIEMITTAEG